MLVTFHFLRFNVSTDMNFNAGNKTLVRKCSVDDLIGACEVREVKYWHANVLFVEVKEITGQIFSGISPLLSDCR